MKKVLMVLLVIVVVVVGCGGGAEPEINIDDIKVELRGATNDKWVTNYGWGSDSYLKITNNTGESIGMIKVLLKFMDSEGCVVDTNSIRLYDIEPYDCYKEKYAISYKRVPEEDISGDISVQADVIEVKKDYGVIQ